MYSLMADIATSLTFKLNELLKKKGEREYVSTPDLPKKPRSTTANQLLLNASHIL